MGNCCGGEADEPSTYSSSTKTPVFQGQGHRLGTADESKTSQNINIMNREDDALLPEPIHNPNLTDGEREQQRLARLAAAEARAQKALQPKKPKKQSSSQEPLRGPNSKPTMAWTVGN